MTEKKNLENANKDLQDEVKLRCEQVKEFIKKGDQAEISADIQI